MLYLILIILIAGFLFDLILDYLNIKNWSAHVPDLLKDVYSEDKYVKAKEYALANYRFSKIQSFLTLTIILLCLLTGFFGKLDEYARTVSDNPIWIAMIFFGIIVLASDLISTPFELYKTFVIEQKFGFNNTELKTFIADKLKGYFLTAIIGSILLTVLVKTFEVTGNNFWWIAWLFLIAFMFITTVFYASWILPIFNKLNPLPEGELRNAIEEYSRKNDFPLQDVFVMDGSKRSSKANAFFSGLGKKKKIVLYDTLIHAHTKDELVAVLAHETGHYKLKHTMTSFVLAVAQTGIMLFVYSLLQNNPQLAIALGAGHSGFHLELLAFGFLYSPISGLTSLFMHILSRKNEYEADAFAKKTYSGTALINALKKLSADNLSNLTPHPAYVFFHYSHPPLLKRLEALTK